MPLIDLKTNLKSLKYGKDRIGGGDSGQPYITNDINNPTNVLGFDDGLVRGGAVGAAKSSVIDTLRIGKFLTDIPKGPLFIVKQAGLQFSNPKLEVKKSLGGFLSSLLTGDLGPATGGALQPTRLYNLGINTLAQVPVNAFGIHFNRHGLLPVQDESTKYLAVVTANNKGNSKNNRLVDYLNTKMNVTTVAGKKTSLLQKLINLIPIVKGFAQPKQQILNSYLGGPGSVYGVGTTLIKRYDYTTVHEKQNNQLPQDKGQINYSGLLGVSNRYFQPSSNSIQGIAKNAIQNASLTSGALGILGSIFGSAIKSQSGEISIYNHIDLANPTSPPPQINNTAVTYKNNTFAGRTYEELNNQIDKNTQAPQPHSTVGGNPGNVQYFGDLGVSKDYFPNPFDLIDLNHIANNGKTISLPTAITYNSNSAVGKYLELQQIVADQQSLINVNSVGIYNTNINGTKVDNTKGNYSTTALVDANNSGSIQYKNSYGEVVKIKGYSSWNQVARENRVGSGRTDSINLTPVFSKNTGTIGDEVTIPGVIGTNPNGSCNINDLVKFRIQAIDGANPNSSDWMIFRAYVTQFSDSVDATWNSVKYAGRGEDFYIYGGFGRKIQIGFKVAALSVIEMEPMYQKLNYLMSNLMPDYNGTLMRGPLVKMTVGNWLDGQAGILNSLSYTVPQDSPWEISLGEDRVGTNTLILPHIVEVSMTFTPIGSQTKGINKISEKSYSTSHIAQNINDTQYITGNILQGT